ncbi:terminase gpP N-terminus-related DNA-binding protein [Psychrobacillus sp. L4]|uniref:terminase gpP N-terminus-related DNA-binding protein n=1 Tax=Psychrobacillus sp. L4 TaxID=3236892 RepID=UPI0036F29362
MTKFMVYTKIYELYAMGFSKSAIARKLSISRNTVAKYLKNTSEEFEEYLFSLQTRKKK